MVFASILHTFNHIIWCSNQKKSYTTCSVWLTFRKNLKRCNGQCALEQSLKQGRLVLKCWRNMLLAGCNLPGILLNNTSCKETIYIDFVETSNISYRLMKMSLSLILLHGICFFNKGTVFLQKESTQRQTNSWNKKLFSAEIQYVNQCNTSLMELKSLTIFFLHNMCLKGRIPLLKNCVFFVLLFDSYGRAYCIHAVMSLLQMILIYIHFYFRFLKIKYCCIFFQSIDS